MGDNKTYLTEEIVKYSQKLDHKGFGANHDGNISAKLTDDVLLATPTAVSKGNVVSDIILTLDMEGKKLSGIGKPFSEIKLHLAAYNLREDARAVVHAHPPFATARGLAGLPLVPNLPEAIVSLGDIIPVADFAMPGAAENNTILATMLEQADVFMMPGNGVLAIGNDVEQAYLRLELTEHLAKIQYYAEHMGTPIELSSENIDTLLEKRAAAGLGPKPVAKPNNDSLDSLKAIIAAEVQKALGDK